LERGEGITVKEAIYGGARAVGLSSVTTRRYLMEEIYGEDGALLLLEGHAGQPNRVYPRPHVEEAFRASRGELP
jgi:hypothetical protein